LDCYDAKIAPEPKQVSVPAKTVEDCRFLEEQDERLNCFNRFVNAPSKKSAPATAQVSAQTLRTCLTIEDQSKERLDCYDAKISPEPTQVSVPAKAVEDCRFVKEQDERLNCFIGL
jgi:ubiquitin